MSRDPLLRPCYEIRLRPEQSCTDPVRALRRLLKLALRRFGLRAVSIAETQPNTAERRSSCLGPP
jgi:hypothetical protein